MESLQKISVREKQGEEINHDLLDCWFCSAWGASCPGRGGDLKKVNLLAKLVIVSYDLDLRNELYTFHLKGV